MTRFVVAVVFQITHGHVVSDFKDRFVKIAEDSNAGFSQLMKPGRFLVDSFPIRVYTLPEWQQKYSDSRFDLEKYDFFLTGCQVWNSRRQGKRFKVS